MKSTLFIFCSIICLLISPVLHAGTGIEFHVPTPLYDSIMKYYEDRIQTKDAKVRTLNQSYCNLLGKEGNPYENDPIGPEESLLAEALVTALELDQALTIPSQNHRVSNLLDQLRLQDNTLWMMMALAKQPEQLNPTMTAELYRSVMLSKFLFDSEINIDDLQSDNLSCDITSITSLSCSEVIKRSPLGFAYDVEYTDFDLESEDHQAFHQVLDRTGKIDPSFFANGGVTSKPKSKPGLKPSDFLVPLLEKVTGAYIDVVKDVFNNPWPQPGGGWGPDVPGSSSGGGSEVPSSPSGSGTSSGSDSGTSSGSDSGTSSGSDSGTSSGSDGNPAPEPNSEDPTMTPVHGDLLSRLYECGKDLDLEELKVNVDRFQEEELRRQAAENQKCLKMYGMTCEQYEQHLAKMGIITTDPQDVINDQINRENDQRCLRLYGMTCEQWEEYNKFIGIITLPETFPGGR